MKCRANVSLLPCLGMIAVVTAPSIAKADTLYSVAVNPAAYLGSPSTLTPLTLATTGSAVLSSISFETRQVAPLSTGATAVVSFWTNVPLTGVNNVLSTATLISGQSYSTGIASSLGNSLTTISLPNIVVPSTVYVEVQYLNADTSIDQNASVFYQVSSTPTVGTNPGWEWFETPSTANGIFDANEASGESPPPGGNDYSPYGPGYQFTNQFTVVGTAVPEPASLGVIALGSAALLRRRRA